jgi:hypothetical protein
MIFVLENLQFLIVHFGYAYAAVGALLHKKLGIGIVQSWKISYV